MKYHLFLIVLLSLTAAVVGEDRPPPSFLPSLNYWEISQQISRSEALRVALEIAPWQDAAIREMRSKKDFEQSFFQKKFELEKQRKEESEQQIRMLPGNNIADTKEKRLRINAEHSRLLTLMFRSDNSTWTELNDLVESELRKILTDSQMTALRPTTLRKKYSTGFSPFTDAEVVTFCGVSTAESERIQADFEEAQRTYRSTVSAWQLQSGQKVAGSLPPTSRQLFSQYMGDTLKIGLQSNPEMEFDSLPFPPITQVIIVLESVDLQNELKLSPSQLQRLVGIHERFISQLHSVPGKSTAKHIDDISNELAVSARQVLTNKQAVYLAQHIAVEGFLKDYSSTFSRLEFLDYLKLDEQESKAIVDLAAAETRGLRFRIRELDLVYFNAISAKLSGPSKQKIRDLFRGVWEIEL